jgi:hypothetical protein
MRLAQSASSEPWLREVKRRRHAKLRTVANPKADFAWLAEIEQDLALVMEPRSKFDRVVLAERLVQAGLTLVREAEAISKYPFERAIGIRNGLIIALLAVCPRAKARPETAPSRHGSLQLTSDWVLIRPA